MRILLWKHGKSWGKKPAKRLQWEAPLRCCSSNIADVIPALQLAMLKLGRKQQRLAMDTDGKATDPGRQKRDSDPRNSLGKMHQELAQEERVNS